MILNGNVLETLLLLCIPTIMMAIVQSLIPITDGLFLNNIIGPIRTGAITYSKPSIDVLLGLSQGLGVAAMAMIGQTAGRGDVEKVKEISLQILIFAIFCGLILIPITFFIAFLMSSTVEASMQKDVFTYITLFSFVIPFQFMASIFNSMKNSTGNPESPFYRMIVLLILKVSFNFIFLKVLGLDIPGAVLASFCSYLLTAVWMYYDLFVKDQLYRLSFKGYKINIRIIKEVVRLGIPSMLSFMMINLGFLLINMEVESYGKIVLSGLGIASSITGFCFQLPASISTTVTTMISLNIGINNKQKAKKTFNVGMIVSLSIAFIIIFAIIPTANFWTSKFTRQEDVLAIANSALEIYTYSIIPYAIFMICQSVFNALGKNFLPLIMGFLRIWLFRYVFILFTKAIFGYYSVFYGNLFSNFMACIIFLIITFNITWETGMSYAEK